MVVVRLGGKYILAVYWGRWRGALVVNTLWGVYSCGVKE